MLSREVKQYAALGRLEPCAQPVVMQSITPAILIAFLGARVFHILDFPREFMADPAAMIFTRGRFSIFGGLVFGIVAGVVMLRRQSVSGSRDPELTRLATCSRSAWCSRDSSGC